MSQIHQGWSRKIVVGIDGSDMSNAALQFALDEARLRGAPLCVVHTWMPAGLPLAPDLLISDVEAMAVIDDALERYDCDGVAVTRHTPVGSAAGALIEAATGCDLLVVGRHGAGLHPYLGGVTQQVVHHSNTPVAVVPPVAVQGSGIVVGVDGSKSSGDALDWAVTEGTRRARPVTAVLAWSLLENFPTPEGPTFNPHYSSDTALDALTTFVHEAEASGTEVTLRTINDLPVPALLSAAAQAELVVCGTRGMGGFHGLLVGSVSRRLVAEALCPVVCVR